MFTGPVSPQTKNPLIKLQISVIWENKNFGDTHWVWDTQQSSVPNHTAKWFPMIQDNTLWFEFL